MLIDPDDQEELDLFAQIQIDPESDTAADNLIDLLFLLVKKQHDSSQGQRVAELVSYLGSHVALLQAIVQDPKLTSLFLVGQNGSQSFNSIQKMSLNEQAARTRKFLSQFSQKPAKTTLMDYESLFKARDLLPKKIAELTAMKERVDQDDDPTSLKASFREVCSILETVLLFNDLLIRNKSAGSEMMVVEKPVVIEGGHDDDLKDENKRLKAENKRLRCDAAAMNDTIVSLSSRVQNAEAGMEEISQRLKSRDLCRDAREAELEELQREKERLVQSLGKLKARVGSEIENDHLIEEVSVRLRTVEKQYKLVKEALDEVAIRNRSFQDRDLADELESELQNLRKENALLASQVKQLQSQVENYQNLIGKKDQRIDGMSGKIKLLSDQHTDALRMQTKQQNAISELQALYKEASEQVDRLMDEKSALAKQLSRAKKETASVKGDNEELKHILERTTEESKKQMSDNAVLLRQLRKSSGPANDSQDKDAEIARLKAQLKDAKLFIKKLQREITEYRARQKHTEAQYAATTQKAAVYQTFEPPQPAGGISSSSSTSQWSEIVRSKPVTQPRIRSESSIEEPSAISASSSSSSLQVLHQQKQQQQQRTVYTSTVNYKGDIRSMQPNLDELDAAIRQLELTIHRSRKESGLSASSD